MSRREIKNVVESPQVIATAFVVVGFRETTQEFTRGRHAVVESTGTLNEHSLRYAIREENGRSNGADNICKMLEFWSG